MTAKYKTAFSFPDNAFFNELPYKLPYKGVNGALSLPYAPYYHYRNHRKDTRLSLYLLAAIIFLLALSLSPPLYAQTSQAEADINERTDQIYFDPKGAIVQGRSNAAVTVTKFLNYGCPACSRFETAENGDIERDFVRDGAVKLRLIFIPFNIIDASITMVARCSGTQFFKAVHNSLFSERPQWQSLAGAIEQEKITQWQAKGLPFLAYNIALATQADQIAVRHGVNAVELRSCFLKEQAAWNWLQASIDNFKASGAQHTPSFSINGELLDHVHSWPKLREQIETVLDDKNESGTF